MQGLIGKKLGMTQIFDAKGRRIAVTVIEAGPCVVVQRKTREKDGYEAVQLGFGDRKERLVNKAALARFKKINVSPKRHLKEFAIDAGEEVKEGDVVTGAIFVGVSHVDIAGVTKGKGFQGVVRRHRMAGGPITHGGHSKRRIGAIGQRARPGNVAKDHHMPGHMGHVNVTAQNLELVEVREEGKLILVRGAIPGPTGAVVFVMKALKKKVKAA
ncbi:MAG: 50S ribosomal protein L3 [Verrucomicrobia bacterium]|nr:50S ribosomal protein L3 [Verrucomicrobiota bacterium]